MNWNLVALIVALILSIVLYVIFLVAETIVEKVLTKKEKWFVWIAVTVILSAVALCLGDERVSGGFSTLLSVSVFFWSCHEILNTFHERMGKTEPRFAWILKMISLAFLGLAIVYAFFYVTGHKWDYIESTVDGGLLSIISVALMALAYAVKKKESNITVEEKVEAEVVTNTETNDQSL
ncbi:hypothetical protein V7146_11530 [Gottfriedia acidiceleris]|uniref:hypothetical protein n=1 Tax=Gottfriedia acidiceleris TaxID=371036 RepID=UPI002FFF996B